MSQLEIAKNFFINDKFAMKTTGIDILEVGPHYAKTVLKINERILNGLGKVMGGAIFTLADFSFAVASNPLNEKGEAVEKTVTENSNISFLSSAKGDTLFCECILVKDGRTVCTYETKVTDNLGTLVAFVVTNGIKIGK